VIDLPLLSSAAAGVALARNIAIFLAVAFWLGLAYWVHRDARRRIRNRFSSSSPRCSGSLRPTWARSSTSWSGLPRRTTRYGRGAFELQALEQQRHLACPVCTTMLRQACATRNAPLEPLWLMCPYCASPIEPSELDLDTALTAEAKTIALVDHRIPRVPQAEPRAADA
jgi:hypothetical protein